MSVLTTVSCISIVGIIVHLINRLDEWLWANAEEAIAHKQGVQLLAILDSTIAKEQNKEIKAKFIEAKEKLEKTIGPANKSRF